MDAFLNKDMQEHIEAMKKDFDKEYSERIEKLIYKINQPNFNSYESLSEMINDFQKELQTSDLFDNIINDELLPKWFKLIESSNRLNNVGQ